METVPAQSATAGRGDEPAGLCDAEVRRQRSKDVYARVTRVGGRARHRVRVRAHCPPAQYLAAKPDRSPARRSRRTTACRTGSRRRSCTPASIDGVDLTSRENLVVIATAAGLDRAEAERCIADPQSRQAVARDEQRARAIGVEGVPFFIFNGKLAVSGAQGSAALLEAMRQAETAAV
ncbi:MAG: DsbA family protein [Betaproteobacteria bacterium]|nr:DsbA family protein [Betaproteobacteria bacterium]